MSMKKFLLIPFIFAVLFAACDPDDPNDGVQTTTEEDKANIKASFDRVKNLTQNFRNGNFYHFAEEFLGVGPTEDHDYLHVGNGNGDYGYPYYKHTPGTGNFIRYEENCNYPEYDGFCYKYVGAGEGDYTAVYEYKYVGEGNGNYKQGDPYTSYDMLIPEFTELLGDEFGRIVNLEQIEEQRRFNMASFAGEYTWNNTQKKWNKASRQDILVSFPSAKDKAADCELGITVYEDKECDIEGEKIWLPTKVSSSFKKDGERIAGVDVSADFNSYGIPKQATASIYAKPIVLEAVLNQQGASKFSASLLVMDETNDENALQISGEATLSNAIDNYTDLSDCKINHLKIKVTQSKLVIDGSIDLKTLNDQENPDIAAINACLILEVYYDGQKTGTLRVKEVGESQYLYIVYKDGTEENTEVYYDSFLTDIENMFLKK